MKTKLFLLLVIFLATGTASIAFQNDGDHTVLFEKAKYSMETRGDLKEAISLFESLINTYPNEKQYAANSQLLIGMCYEKLGRSEATKAYQTVLEKYPDQQMIVAKAQEKLSALSLTSPVVKMSNQVIVQKIYSKGILGSISPDGNDLSYVDWNLGNMAIYNLKTGEKRLITKEGTWTPPMQFGDISVWSPDGKFIAYYWIRDSFGQLRIQEIETGKDWILREGSVKDKCPWPFEWTNDGKYLLAENSDGYGQRTLELVSVKDGSAKIIKTFGDQGLGGASMSPDGKYIVVCIGREKEKRDIHILSVDGTLDNELISFPGADWAPNWTPDGKKIIFASNRSGSPALWTVKVKDGQKTDEPVLIYDGISGSYKSLRFTNEGNLIFLSGTGYSSIFQSTINPDKGTIENAISITVDCSVPFWSPDGSKLGYIGKKGEDGNNVVIIRDLNTGKEKELKLRLKNLEQASGWGWAWPQWSLDGESLLLDYEKKEGGKELVLVNIETENKKYIKGTSWPIFGPENTILFVDILGNKIIKKNISSGKEEVLFERDKQIYHLSISEDKTTLAFYVGEMGTGGTQQELYSMPINSSKPKMLWKATKEQFFTWHGGLNFFPDGKTLLLSLSTKNIEKQGEKSQQLFTININTLEKKPLGKERTDPNDFFEHVRLSPDGKKIAFSKIRTSGNIWSLEFDF